MKPLAIFARAPTNFYGDLMLEKTDLFARNKSSLGLLTLALIVGGFSAQASGPLNTASGGYLICVNAKTKVVTHPGTSKCPAGSKKLVLGTQGAQGATGDAGLAGAAGLAGKDGRDGKTLWNGVKDPESTWGAPGDMFINSVTKTLFGPKDLTTGWPAGVSMVGPQGANGANGSAGATGPAGSDATLTCAQGGTCILGDTGPGGGKVFYFQAASPDAPWRYLEAAPNTWSGGSADPLIVWCSNAGAFVSNLSTGDTLTVTTASSFGSGFSNTKAMLGSCTFGAANAAAAYNGGGKSDWFLPSLAQLNELYARKSFVGGFIVGSYWTSTESAANAAWRQNFGTGLQENNLGKGNVVYVRPVWAF
jgi:hypothetical protein